MGVLFTTRYNVYFIYLYSFRFTFTLFDQFSRCYQVLLLLDVLSAQSELFPRLDKGLVKDHKIGGKLDQASSSMTSPGVERVQMVKNRDIKGALATDQALREVVEKRVSHGIFIQTSFLFEFLIKSFV